MKDGIGLFVGLVYSLNIVVGAGFLNLPYGYKQSGTLLSTFYMIFFSILSTYLSLIFLEVIHKGCLLKHQNALKPDFNKTLTESLISTHIPDNSIDHKPHHHHAEVDDISIVFGNIFGYRFGFIYLCFITIYFEGALLAYSSIFASSFASNVPLYYLPACDIYEQGFYSQCIFNYWIYLAIFATVVIYLSIRGMKEQKTFQIIMCAIRFIIMSLIIFCSVDLISSGLTIDGKPADEPDPPLINIPQAHVALPIIIFSLLYQLLLPSVAEIVRKREENMWKIIVLVTIIIFIFYGSLGSIIPYAISNVKEQISLNFRDYTGGLAEKNIWGYFVMYSVVLLPALDVISCFPFKTISLADNWGHMIYGHGEKSVHVIRSLTVAAAVIPISLAAVFYNIASILGIVGLVPVLLFHTAVPIAHNIVREKIKEKTSFDAIFYSKSLNYAISFGSSVLFVYLLYQKLA
ncbi:hypothetical protein SteCoe_33417 [Stentor coeruleus]|uniref:Amino acid transporter transmembrane domain-containing protein n=1 Tax=Stentor coeruleus TaxID=5963 RepID=A0A1R2AWV1_9CILI|nr:hypothetical protein SteCoe_33417 [Stentor coeruleus]